MKLALFLRALGLCVSAVLGAPEYCCCLCPCRLSGGPKSWLSSQLLPASARVPGGSSWRADVCIPHSQWTSSGFIRVCKCFWENTCAPCSSLLVGSPCRVSVHRIQSLPWLMVPLKYNLCTVVVSSSTGRHDLCHPVPKQMPSVTSVVLTVTYSLDTVDLITFLLRMERNDRNLFCFSWFQETFHLFFLFSYSFNFKSVILAVLYDL